MIQVRFSGLTFLLMVAARFQEVASAAPDVGPPVSRVYSRAPAPRHPSSRAFNRRVLDGRFCASSRILDMR
jgi:hypothetical protein